SELFFGRDAGASFTAVTQLGTEAAVLIYFAKDIWRLTKTWFLGARSAEVRATFDYKLAWYVIVGTIPIGVLGFAFKDDIRSVARNLWLVSANLIIFALLLAAAEYWSRQKREIHDMTLRDGIVMGLAQAMALVPGVSRSGGTITAGLAIGMTREAATRYSFLLAIPAVVAAGIFSLEDVFSPSEAGVAPSLAQMIVATAIAFGLGYASIAWLLRWVAKHSVYVFVGYRILLGGGVLALLATGVINAT
ncbi:MAG: undecaprenyl-diphosphate phosphatase, partial [Micromonosporaceae bacterium]